MLVASTVNDVPYDPSTRPGWSTIVELTTYLVGDARDSDEKRREIESASVRAGRLHFELADPPQSTRDVLATARALSGETCEICGGKGNPVGDARLRPFGSRCESCRAPDSICLPRDWPEPRPKRDAPVTERGRRTLDHCRTADGSNLDSCHRTYSVRIDDSYVRDIALLMQAADDEQSMIRWTGTMGGGWAGLIRALFMALLAERAERSAGSNQESWRHPSMKEKYGTVDVSDPYGMGHDDGAVTFIEIMSEFVCMRCGALGQVRNASWVVTECDACWAKASEKAHASERAWREWAYGRFEGPIDDFRGVRVEW